MEVDRRKTYRVPFSPEEGSHVAFSPIGFTGRIKPPQTGVIFNLSEGGMSALIHMKVRKGKKFWVDIHLPGLLRSLRVMGKVVWVETDDRGTQVGLNFIDTPPPAWTRFAKSLTISACARRASLLPWRTSANATALIGTAAGNPSN
jgi:hypothetical protein